jgi:hypothetical protein
MKKSNPKVAIEEFMDREIATQIIADSFSLYERVIEPKQMQ